MAQKIYTPATKSMNPWDVDDNRGWDILGGNKDTPEKELVPTVADCVDELGKGLASIPFSIYNEKGDKVDDGDDYKNVTSLLPDPYAFFWLTGTSLVLSGQAYWGKKNNTFGFSKGLRYWAFPNVRPNITTGTTKENLTFEYDGKKIPAKDVLYMWLPDPRVEFGPPSNYPMKRAEKSAGAVSAISEFVNNYMNSGMVKAFIASSESMPKDQEEKAQMEDYLTRILTGVRRAVMRIRVISKNLTFTPVGGGLDELRNVGVIKEIKQDILEAFGVPASRVWGNAANYATAANDTIVFITSEVMPLALVVQAAVNEQVFAPFGYKLVFEPRRMEEFAVVTAEKIKILQPVTETLSKVLSPAEALKAAVDITGIDLSPDVMEQIEAQILEEKKAKEKPAPPVVVATDAPAPQYQEPTVTETPDAGTTKALVELDKWQAKSEKAGTLVTWHAVALPVEIVDAVKAGATWQEAREMILNIKAPPVGHPFYGNQWIGFSAGTAENAPRTVSEGDTRKISGADAYESARETAFQRSPATQPQIDYVNALVQKSINNASVYENGFDSEMAKADNSMNLERIKEELGLFGVKFSPPKDRSSRMEIKQSIYRATQEWIKSGAKIGNMSSGRASRYIGGLRSRSVGVYEFYAIENPNITSSYSEYSASKSAEIQDDETDGLGVLALAASINALADAMKAQ